MLGVLYVSSREKLFPVKFMLGVPYVSSSESVFRRENYAWCPICFFPVKNYSPWNLCLVSHMFLPVKTVPVKIMLGVPYVSSLKKLFPCEIYAGCPICFFPVKNYPSWTLCLVSHMFLPREIYAGCPICLFQWKSIPPWNLC